MDQDAGKVPMERINYEPGTGPRFTLLVFTKDTHKLVRKYGGNSVSPLYGPQAYQLRRQERKAGSSTPARGRPMIGPDF